jgi:hypothetical protein
MKELTITAASYQKRMKIPSRKYRFAVGIDRRRRITVRAVDLDQAITLLCVRLDREAILASLPKPSRKRFILAIVLVGAWLFDPMTTLQVIATCLLVSYWTFILTWLGPEAMKARDD